jgi:hypothetical protein
MADRETYSAEQVDAAVAALTDPERLKHAQEVITHAAPALQRILNQALDESGYLRAAGAQIAPVAAIADETERELAIRTLLADETRLGMLVGATIGFELARELAEPSSSIPKELTDPSWRSAGWATRRSPSRPTAGPSSSTRSCPGTRPAAASARRWPPTRSSSPTGTPTTSATPWRSPGARARPSWPSRSWRASSAGRASTSATPTSAAPWTSGVASVRLVPAWHTATSPSGTVHTPAGLVIEMGGKRIYHLGDTALFSDLALPSRRGHIDVALMCIGGHYTMDRFDAVVAAEWVKADQIIPCHFNTFPPIETDAQAFRTDVEQAGFAQVVVLEPGGTHTT